MACRDLRRIARCGVVGTAAAASVMLVLFVFTVATFPDEWLEVHLPPLPLIHVNDENGPRWESLHEYLFVGRINEAGKSSSLWSNRLELPRLDIIDHAKYDTEAKFEALPETFSLRTRHLEGAVLSQTNLRKVDFTAAHLQGALLDQAQLQGAAFTNAELQGAYLDAAHLQGVQLDGAHLEAASLGGAQLQGALLFGAKLYGSKLDGAQLQGASLDAAGLRGAFLARAQLQGASFKGADLQGACLVDANVQSTSFTLAHAWLAETRSVTLLPPPASKDAYADDCFSQIDEKRRLVLAKGITGIREGDPTSADRRPPQDDGSNIEAETIGIIEKTVPKGKLRDQALARLEKQFGLGIKTQEFKMKAAWFSLSNGQSEDLVEFKRGLVQQWIIAGCTADGAYVIHGLLLQTAQIEAGSRSIPSALAATFAGPDRSIPPDLARHFLERERYPGGYGLSEADKAGLMEIRERQPINSCP
jgi:uncharacterized protein YjbI with pentapeptide repeats